MDILVTHLHTVNNEITIECNFFLFIGYIYFSSKPYVHSIEEQYKRLNAFQYIHEKEQVQLQILDYCFLFFNQWW